MMLLAATVVRAQEEPASTTEPVSKITIAGNVYGGGNAGDTDGSTKVTIYAGELNEVYGGARKADIKGHTFVHIDGEHASEDILITSVYGGNDIGGKIGDQNKTNAVPDELTQISTKSGTNAIDNTWNAFIRTSRSSKVVDGKEVEDKVVIIGSLFGGGNGDYDYTSDDSPYKGLVKPELDKTYLEILGGCIAHLYGGGNNATVTDNTTICINNTSDVLDQVAGAWAQKNGKPIEEVLAYLMTKVKLSTFQSNLTSYAFNFARVFGGNNKAEMKIRPIWDLQNGVVRDLYSGGNQGTMTSPEGLLLNIEKKSKIVVDNLYGGCRMADVCPKVGGVYTETTKTFEGYNFPEGYSARVVIRGGDVNNVYGGNDISGKVYGGNAVGISATIRGDVYGGGNGSYAYTDNPELGKLDLYKDFYYDKGSNSVDALNAVRPNAEQVSIHVSGTKDKPTVIHGGIYCGGNSATIMSSMERPTVELKIGSYVIADSVFLGNNGANLVKTDVLKYYAGNVDANGTVVTSGGTDYSSLNLTDKTTFETYMDAATMRLKPSVTFDSAARGDGADYEPYTSYFGSFFCGGNVGSMRVPGKVTLNFDKPFYVYNKVVGGCNNANISVRKDNGVALNHEFFGGFIGDPEAGTRNKLELNFAGLKIMPLRWKLNDDGSFWLDPDDNNNPKLEWNTFIGENENDAPQTTGDATADDIARRLKGGNIYGGCYNSGHINGNVIININDTLVERDKIFDIAEGEGDILYENTEKGTYKITKRNSGVILSEQGMDALGSALNVFGGGYGENSEIWGSTTINLNKGYTFQIFGGGEAGAIGKKGEDGKYSYDEAYSTYINLSGDKHYPGVARGATGDSPGMAECEFIYGGAFEGLICGDTHINLNNGRIFNSFAGSCNADILGHTETYVGTNGFPWIRDHIYGGNDLGGSILGNDSPTFSDRIRDEVKAMVTEARPVSSYMEYTQGRVRSILGGCFGNYDYEADAYKNRITNKPYLHNAFVNIRPITNANSVIERVFGAGEGFSGDRDGDKLQDHSYVLVDIPDGISNFANTEIFGAGAYNGLGMRYSAAETFDQSFNISEATAVIDLLRGKVSAAYGGSYEEGITRRTLVNVPEKSTIKINNIFGGAYGMHILPPCDVYEANVNYQGGDARVNGAIYGGNNNVRRTLYAKINVSAPVLKENGYSVTIYGAGRGQYTWSEYTEVNLNKGANAWEVYGGGELGNVLNAESVQKYLQLYSGQPADMVANEDPATWGNPERWVGGTVGGTLKDEYKDTWKKEWMAAWTIDGYYNPVGEFTRYVGNQYTNLTNPLARKAEMDDRDYSKLTDDQKARTYQRYNTNVLIHEGATVGNYAYGGGYGSESIPLSGGVHGSTYIALLGGTVGKDIYAAGTTGSVCDIFGAGAPNESAAGFTASANAYIQGGTVRNVYGGGWEGHVGYHNGAITTGTEGDIPAEAHVVVGVVGKDNFLSGSPAVTRNVYGGGEGGSVYGDAYVTVNNGYIGYRYKNGDYVEELDDAKPGDNDLLDGGNVFGGGYVVNSYTDASHITMWGGTVRGCLYGGGELGPIGRGTVLESAPTANAFINGAAKIYKGGETHVTLYKGHVMREVYGGGRGFDNWGGDGTLHMSEEVKKNLDLSSKGFVFGSTDVHIRGGEVGTLDGVADGYGNVFGGGNVGYVYSATGTKRGTRTTIAMENLESGLPKDGGGYYYKTWSNTATDRELSLDCNVVVEPYCEVTGSSVTIGDRTFTQGKFVPVEYLNKLAQKSKDSRWNSVNMESGVMIHNAVFAGGNITVGNDQVSANTATVLGNVTAALRDVYNLDLITIGTEHVGGLYGDGNLTFVDGWRELHIDNYGTDYYGLQDNITKDAYNSLNDRERAYFVLNYSCKREFTYNGKTFTVGTRMTSDEFRDAFEGAGSEYVNADGTPNEAYWEELGFCSIYAGRLLNTIQRADMAAVFGSRIVLQGARDRVPEKADYTRYTLNRVGELSLNQRRSQAEGEASDNQTHGNYFGIYSVVNYLGNLTSDVFFDDVRKTSTSVEANKADGTTTYYQWKKERSGKPNRNNATSANKVSLASGVYLEIIREESEKTGQKEWGLITGVVELDLIDVKTGMGGGYVYARNQHGAKTWHREWDKVNLSPYNLTARTYKRFTYNESEASLLDFETSGNFVHNTKQIIDDCYPNINAYKGSEKSPAHYWYIKGYIYVYDQYISAFTGSANAYAESVNIPLTISAASHGKLTLRDVQPNLYAYYGDGGEPLGDEGSVIIGGITYHAGDPIDYWTYQTLNETTEQPRFVPMVYTTIAECKVGDQTFKEGHVLLPEEYERLKAAYPKVTRVEDDREMDFTFLIRMTNVVSHDTGYVLSFDMNNPAAWNKNYILSNSANADATHPRVISTEDYESLSNEDKGKYQVGPTYSPVETGVYGQRQYTYGEILSKHVYDNNPSSYITDQSTQAKVEQAYVVTGEVTVTNREGTEQHLYPGTPVVKSAYTDEAWAAISGSLAEAYVCTNTLELSESELIYANDLIPVSDIADIRTKLRAYYPELATATDAALDKYLKDYLDLAYYCTADGLFGGAYYEAGKAYNALDAWSSLSEADRDKFRFNYDGMDLLIDPDYDAGYVKDRYGFKPQYDGYIPGTTAEEIARTASEAGRRALAHYEGCTPLYNAETRSGIYSATQPIDYEAEFMGANEQHSAMTYTDATGTHTVTYGQRLKRKEFEAIPNERIHWSPIIVDQPGSYYVVKQAFIRGDVPYTVGQVIDKDIYESLTNLQRSNNIDVINVRESDLPIQGGSYQTVHYYYCREPYTINEHGEGKPVTTLGIKTGSSVTTYSPGQEVPVGVLINESTYSTLVNKQARFVIHGTAPEETATLYVPRMSDIFDLSTEKIITVVYLYEYHESDETGNNITPVSERHIVNIHLNFESGVPEIGPVNKPATVLPGTTVGLKVPSVKPGAFEITGSGWEMFTNQDDALLHFNGQPYQNNATPMYWYQNNYWVAYYAQTYLGKTYSEPVQFSVANYHDLKTVMDDTEHHYYIDHKDVDREPKVYINDYSADGENGLDLFRDLIDLTHGKDVGNHQPLTLDNPGKELQGGKYLEVFLGADQDHSDSGWTPLANGDGECFSGNFHGEGYTVSGLDHSLFGHLCGNVYNLGVSGSFTSAGVADTGDGLVVNSWVKTTGTPDSGVKAVFGGSTSQTTGNGQTVNCYYPETNAYAAGGATKLPEKAFYNGELAYNLNSYYLYKRYFDNSSSGTGDTYYYFVKDTDSEGNAVLTKKEGRYDSDFMRLRYVEDRYADGDFFYAGGVIPDEPNERQYMETDDEGNVSVHYYPVWPDDYLFFGQKLTYGYTFAGTAAHEDVPSHLSKTGDNQMLADDASSNRVYRTPAYFGNKKAGAFHFNPFAILAAKSADGLHEAYPGMTAVDFTGFNDKGYSKTFDADGIFFSPVFDAEVTLAGVANADETRNLLVYSPLATTDNGAVLTGYFTDPEMAEKEDDATTGMKAAYRAVDALGESEIRNIHGHLVYRNGNSFTAASDHVLVDRQDFNCPIRYTFGDDDRMWYQRKPGNYVDERKGWESVSLPFSAELVTTPDKGEITHFFGGSSTGHEYWLREFKGGSVSPTDSKIFVGAFEKPDAGTEMKEYTNTFLWDYYYSYDSYLDKNTDEYQKNYYQEERVYSNYSYSAPGVPYIIGFPGSRYYEFDLSGKFVPRNTHQPIGGLAAQPIIFASEPGISIAVSDDELTPVKASGYQFLPNYSNTTLQAAAGYVLNGEGSSFDKSTTDAVVGAFRPYFTKAYGGTRTVGSDVVEHIVFGSDSSTGISQQGDPSDGLDGTLKIYAKKRTIIVESTLNHTAEVSIYTPAGIKVASFAVKAGETVETQAAVGGVYIVQGNANKVYTRKLIVR